MTPDGGGEPEKSRPPLNAGQAIVLALIRIYQCTLSKMLPPSCRFYPSCSEYAWQAVQRYGVWRGGWMATKRLARCHPFNPGGYDPVP